MWTVTLDEEEMMAGDGSAEIWDLLGVLVIFEG